MTGGRYEETEYESAGSGSLYARESLKKSYRPDSSREDALRNAIQALTDAADEDRATGGVDLTRGIYPVVNCCTTDGIDRAPDEEIERIFRSILEAGR